jgi:hypothetical protein
MNLLKCLAGMNWGADQGILLKVHEMMLLSALEFGSSAYGSSRDGQLKRLEPVHNKGLRIANLCESGFESLKHGNPYREECITSSQQVV